MNILAIDLGKFNSMCCFFNTETRNYSFWPATTSRSYMESLMKGAAIDRVVMEACGPSGWMHDLCQELKLETLVCSTNEEAWRWKNVKRKTDKDDALKLARLAMMQQLKPVHVPTRQGREHRTLVKYRKTLDQRINRIKNAIRSLFANRGIEIDSVKLADDGCGDLVVSHRQLLLHPFLLCAEDAELRCDLYPKTGLRLRFRRG